MNIFQNLNQTLFYGLSLTELQKYIYKLAIQEKNILQNYGNILKSDA